ncbi:hypothetical protein MCEORH2_01211 [Methylophilaceae bacterium]
MYLFAIAAALVCSKPLRAEQLSPYSPALYLQENQFESDSAVAYFKSSTRVDTRFFSLVGKSEGLNFYQYFAMGLPDAYAISVSTTYVGTLKADTTLPGLDVQAFSSPIFTGSKLWGTEQPWRLKLSLGVQPMLSPIIAQPGFVNVVAGVTGMYVGPDQWVASLSASEKTNNNGTFRTTTFGGNLSKGWGDYLILFSANGIRSPSSQLTDGSVKKTHGYLAYLTVSRAVTKNLWLGLTCSRNSLYSDVSQAPMGLSGELTTDIDAVELSARILF